MKNTKIKTVTIFGLLYLPLLILGDEPNRVEKIRNHDHRFQVNGNRGEHMLLAYHDGVSLHFNEVVGFLFPQGTAESGVKLAFQITYRPFSTGSVVENRWMLEAGVAYDKGNLLAGNDVPGNHKREVIQSGVIRVPYNNSDVEIYMFPFALHDSQVESVVLIIGQSEEEIRKSFKIVERKFGGRIEFKNIFSLVAKEFLHNIQPIEENTQQNE